MTDDKRVAVLGYGLAGSAFHPPFVAATPGLRLTAVVTGNAERQAAVRERYPDTAVVSTVEEMLAQRPDLVVVDKPVAGTVAEVEMLRDLADSTGALFTVFQNRRWDGDFRTVRDLLRSGRLADVSRFESRFERAGRPGARSAWKTSTDPLDLAHIGYDLGSHLVDQAIVAFGPVEWVYAEASSPRAEVLVEEDATILLRHVSGVRSCLRMSNAVQPAAPRFAVLGASASYRCWGLDPQEKALRAGTRPTDAGFGVYPQSQWGALVTDAGTEEVPTLDGDYLSFWAAVEASLRGEGAPPVPAEESVRLVRTLTAALRSVRDGVPVVP